MAREIDKAQMNHLRRLLGWVQCEIGQSPEEMAATLRQIASKVDLSGTTQEGKERTLAAYNASKSVPKYIRAAIKALEPVVKEACGEIVDVNPVVERKLRYSRKQLYNRTRKMLR